MIRAIFIVLAAASTLLFSWQYAAALIFIAALYVPLVGVSLGVIYDALYYAPGAGWPIATIAGIIGSIAAFFIARLIRSRVSGVAL